MLKNSAQFVVGEIVSPWRRFHLKFPSGDAKWPSHERSSTKSHRETLWKVEQQLPFLAGEVKRSRALPLFPFSCRARWNQVSRGCVAGTFHHGNYCFGAAHVSWPHVKTAGTRFRVRARVCTAACGDYESECIGTRTTVQVHAVARRCAARHLPARFLR